MYTNPKLYAEMEAIKILNYQGNFAIKSQIDNQATRQFVNK